jgi:hypothetical protein
VLMDRGERGQAKLPADFLEAWSVAVLLDEVVEEVEDFTLALGQWQHACNIRKEKAKVNKTDELPFTFERVGRSNRVSGLGPHRPFPVEPRVA